MPVSYGLFKSRFKKSIADAIYNEIVTKTARYYHFLGKENLWTDFLSPFIPSQDPTVGDVPGAPSDNFRYELHVRRDILTTKIINQSDVSYIVPRVDWVNGNVYDMYDDALSPEEPAPSGAIRLEDARFYVLTSEFNVYKCLDNDYGAQSTFEPTGTSINPFSTADGYKWKFMYTIPISLRNRFLTVEYMPVTTALKAQFYENGAITQVVIEDGGTGYDPLNPPEIIVENGNGYLEDNPFLIKGIVIEEAGDGYTTTPNITIPAPTVVSGLESFATASISVSGGAIDTAILLTAGYGYTADPVAPTIAVDPPILGALDFQFDTDYVLGDYIEYNGIFYQVITAGRTGFTPPSHTTGTETNGTAELQYVATQAVLVFDMEETTAILEAIVGPGGEITGVTIVDGGIGYTSCTLTVFDPSGNGSGADLVPLFNVGNVDTLQANVELLSTNGTIDAMIVLEGGSGYGAAAVTVLGDGTGCTATARVIGGQVVGIDIVDPGYGYTWTDVLITGNGTGAVVRAIMSPLGGHGYNAIDELNANSIMFYSSISRDENQGIVVNNDYRKAGLLKNIRQFNSTSRFKDQIGSGCVKITGIFDKSKLVYDMLLKQSTAEYKQYRIVEFTDTQILVSVFNNFSIAPGDTLVTETGYNIQVTDVSERTIDQFSGDFLFLTVREPFAPSQDQIITVRTVLTI